MKVYLFPFEKLRKGSRVAIYGCGDIGKQFAEQILHRRYAEIICFIDKNAGQKYFMNIPIYEPDEFRKNECDADAVIVASFAHKNEIHQNIINNLSHNAAVIMMDDNYWESPSIEHDVLNKLRTERAETNNKKILTMIADLRKSIEELDLQMKLQNEIAAVNTAAFAEYKNIHSGKDVAVVGAGPSLNKYSPLQNVIHIGVNRVHMNKRIPLDYFFLHDNMIRKNICGEDLKCKKFFGLLAITPNGFCEPSESICARQNASRYYVDRTPSKYLYTDIRFHPLMCFASVAFPALHFALFTNPAKIYLVGCDVTVEGHFDKEDFLTKEHLVSRGGNRVSTMRWNRYHMITGYRRVKEFAQKWYPETEIISINPVNLKGLFKDKYTDERGMLIDRTESPSEIAEKGITDSEIQSFIDRQVEKVLLDRIRSESPCTECGHRFFQLIRGLSSETPNNIEVKCNGCGSGLVYP